MKRPAWAFFFAPAGSKVGTPMQKHAFKDSKKPKRKNKITKYYKSYKHKTTGPHQV
jgi:hypothetical protein